MPHKINAQSLWEKVSNVGLDRVSDARAARHVTFTNRLVFITFFVLLIFFFVSFNNLGWILFTKSLIIGNFATLILIFSLNKWGLSLLSRLILSWMFSVYPFFTSMKSKLVDVAAIEEAMYFMPRLFILTTAIIPVLIFSFKEKIGLGAALIASFIPLIFFDKIHELAGIGYYEMGFRGNIYPTFNALTLTSYVIFITAGIFFKRMNENYEIENLNLIGSLESKNEELVAKNSEIERQWLELETANYEISIINKNLEKVVNNRTKRLLDQAVQFQKFSFKNSHELRAPLANVMGLIKLLKKSQSQAEISELLTMLDKSCSDLDRVVHEINKILLQASENKS